MTGKSKRLWKALLILNCIYWFWFWSYFFAHSVPQQPPPRAMEVSGPFFIVLGRALPTPDPQVFHSLLIRSVLWLNFPSAVLTWPIGGVGVHDATATFAGTNIAGLRLLLTVPLSYGQWYLMAKLASLLIRKVRAGPAPSPTPSPTSLS